MARAPTRPWSMAATMSLCTLTNAVSVEWCLWYADWTGETRLNKLACSVNLASMIHSRTFETKLRLEIGRYEFRSPASRLDFFRKGRTIADLCVAGNYPCAIEALHIAVMTGEMKL